MKEKRTFFDKIAKSIGRFHELENITFLNAACQSSAKAINFNVLKLKYLRICHICNMNPYSLKSFE